MSTHDEVVDLASEVLGRLSPGLLIRTQEAHFRSTTPDDDVLRRIAVSADIDVVTNRSSDAIEVKTTYNISAFGSDESQANEDPPSGEGWMCGVTIHGQWRVRDANELSDDAVRAFALKVGVMALHPYARAHIQGAVVASGWPAYTLDVLTHQDQLFVSEEDPEEVDLSLITIE